MAFNVIIKCPFCMMWGAGLREAAADDEGGARRVHRIGAM